MSSERLRILNHAPSSFLPVGCMPIWPPRNQIQQSLLCSFLVTADSVAIDEPPSVVEPRHRLPFSTSAHVEDQIIRVKLSPMEVVYRALMGANPVIKKHKRANLNRWDSSLFGTC